MPGRQRPVSARYRAHVRAVARHGCRDPASRFVFADLAGFGLDHVQHVPLERHERGHLIGEYHLPLGEGTLAVGAAHVVREHHARKLIRARSRPLHLMRFHGCALSFIRVPGRSLRTDTASATTASAISAAVCAPMSSPIGTCTWESSSALTPSVARKSRIALPRRRLPRRPMYAGSRASTVRSTGNSNLWSCATS